MKQLVILFSLIFTCYSMNIDKLLNDSPAPSSVIPSNFLIPKGTTPIPSSHVSYKSSLQHPIHAELLPVDPPSNTKQVYATKKHFICHTCGQAYVLQYCYQAHLAAHLNIKPFSCEICEAKFSYQSSLTRHRNRVHNPK